MDGSRFDELTRLMVIGVSRRRFFRSAGGGVLGALAGAIGFGSAGAATCRAAGRTCSKDTQCCSSICGPKNPTGRRVCVCPDGQEACRSACKSPSDYLSDPANCGACGNRCRRSAHATATCAGGACDIVCDVDYHRCGDACVRNDDVAHCGTLCEPCEVPANATGTCDGLGCRYACDAGYHDCGGACVRDDSPSSCGASCSPCPAPANARPTCTDGQCGFTCRTGFHTCGDACVANSDPDHCGTSCAPCAAPANATATCDGATCGYTCDSGFKPCGDGCCPSGQTCCNGVCCDAGQFCIGNQCQEIVCLPLQSLCDPFNNACCGDDGAYCSFGANCTTEQGEARCCRPGGSTCAGRCDCCDNYDCQGGVCCGGAGAVQCSSDDECCPGVVCRDTVCCFPEGTACSFDSECCAGSSCAGGVCTLNCLPRGETCSQISAQACCPGYACSGTTPPLYVGSCCGLPGAGQCSDSFECCDDGVCEFNRCCNPEGATCSSTSQCCEGMTCRSGSCQFPCPLDSFACGAGCCAFRQHCVNGACVCLELSAECDPDDDLCCQDEPTYCREQQFAGDFQCCRPLGGSCDPAHDAAFRSDCCDSHYYYFNEANCGDDNLCGGYFAMCSDDSDCLNGNCRGICDSIAPIRYCVTHEDCDCEYELGKCNHPHGFCRRRRCR